MTSKSELRLPAVEVTQGPGRILYTFAVDGKLVPSFATVSRVRRREGALHGYQRPEALSHIAEIRGYLETDEPMIPNAVVFAFDSRVVFEPEPRAACVAYSRPGTLIIPVDENALDESRPGFIVDGQQRLAAVRDAGIDMFPLCATAFITDSVQEQAEQFILVNSTKPLLKGLVYELLPGTDARLPTLLERRRFPARLLTELNQGDGPLGGLVHTPTNPTGVVKDNSVLRMLENSLSNGALYRYRDTDATPADVPAMLATVNNFWSAVRATFADAWGLPPRRSRLMHGAGVVSLGLLMDTMVDRRRTDTVLTSDDFAADLAPISDVCRWTHGFWDFGPGRQRRWNELQNTSKDVELLSNYLLVQYRSRVWDRPTG